MTRDLTTIQVPITYKAQHTRREPLETAHIIHDS